jgi:hypothetical protein
MTTMGTPLMWSLFGLFVLVAGARFLRAQPSGRAQGFDARSGALVDGLGCGVLSVRGLDVVASGLPSLYIPPPGKGGGAYPFLPKKSATEGSGS